ncbi:hypothetical protein AB7C87_11915 [Natrarchaeobius sp. A-rgal3]|uniref:DUF7550 family protein n=1 Tax=Natrarchaeobius versutus TaxID=1679078 RepID=UPI0035104D68
MADDNEPATADDSAANVGHDLEAERTTAPMSEYTSGDVTIGVAVFLIGSAIAFGVPLLALGL